MRGDRALLDTHVRDARLQPQVDIVLFVALAGAHQHLGFGRLQLEKRGQRHAIVEGVGFVGQERDAAVGVILAQRLRAPGAGYPVADDDIAPYVLQRSSSERRTIRPPRRSALTARGVRHDDYPLMLPELRIFRSRSEER